MTPEQIQASLLILVTLGLFAWGGWRYDIVALIALLAAVHLGLVPTAEAFAGFVHPAVITVVAVLVLSRAIARSGLVAWLAERLVPRRGGFWRQLSMLCAVEAGLSAVMNNVGALALLLPVTLAVARQAQRTPALYLMPLAFASLLGGLMTLIGTPPNLIVSNYRAELLDSPYGLLDFAPVGGGMALVGVAFVALLGWRLIPQRQGAQTTPLGQVDDFLSEWRVPAGSPAVGLSMRGLEERVGETQARVVALRRGSRTIPSTAWWERVEPEDLLLMESPPEALGRLRLRLQLEPSDREEGGLQSGPLNAVEALVGPRSGLVGLTSEQVFWRRRYGVNLLGVARQGQVQMRRLEAPPLAVGDVLLLQGSEERLQAVQQELGLLPLAEREVGLAQRRRPAVSLGALGLALLASALGLVSAEIALMTAVVVVVLAGCLRLDEAYQAIDWRVVVLLGAMLPVGGTLESSGVTHLLAAALLELGQALPLVLLLAALMLVTMALSNIVNNAATAVMMAPLAADLAEGLGVDADPFLMGVAVAASAAFMTPIGHQSNTLVMGPGGYRFWDYWPLGLPMQLLVLLVALPLLLLFWPV